VSHAVTWTGEATMFVWADVNIKQEVGQTPAPFVRPCGGISEYTALIPLQKLRFFSISHPGDPGDPPPRQ